MKYLIIIPALFAIVCCKPADLGLVKVSQDTAGNYNIYYNIPGSSRHEISNNGFVTGTYSYVDPNGILQTVNYSSGPQGFVVYDGQVPPAAFAHAIVPVQYTPEVAAARVKHLTIHAAEAARNARAAEASTDSEAVNVMS